MISRIFTDNVLYNLFYIPAVLLYSGFIISDGNINQSIVNFKDKFWICYKSAFGYYTI